MSSSTLHRPAAHGSWWYIAASAVLAGAVLVLLVTAIQQPTPAAHPGAPAVVQTPYRPVTRACFEGRAGVNAIELARPECAASR